MAHMGDLRIQNVNLQQSENQENHRTQGFSSPKALVVRRGAPFKIIMHLNGRPFNPKTDNLMVKVMLGHLYLRLPVTISKDEPVSRWKAYFKLEDLNLKSPSIFISSPANAPVGTYRLLLYVFSQSSQRVFAVGNMILLCNPWYPEDTVFVPFEDQREEHVRSDSGLLYMGSPMNLVSRPWSFDQYEPGVLEACLNLLQVSPQHTRNRRKDYLRRSNPIYISRVVSAMINCEDDRGVLKGNWSGDYKQGTHPSAWTGSGDILTQWARSGFSPVKYGQCWVFAAVMCTVMRVLGIPCRIVTNFNSAHDSNANLVIEEFYSETGKKLPNSRDSIWNFHVWVECWMTRQDLGSGMDGWQVLDPTPQERSGGVFCCGPAPVKAIRDRCVDLVYDIPFVYAEVNADVHTIIMRQGQVVGYSVDSERVGSHICTKAVGFPRPQNITADYKYVKSPNSSLRSRNSVVSEDSTLSRSSSQGVSVSLSLDKSPVAGEPILFTVTVTNREPVAKVIKENLDAQAKEYNHSPSDTFWETNQVIRLAPLEVTSLHHQIPAAVCEGLMGDDLVNLAVVLEDEASQERVLASEEFNITSPQLSIQIADEDSIVPYKEHSAFVSFTNPFPEDVSGVLTVTGSGLIQGKVHFRMSSLRPRGRVAQRVVFLPKLTGTKMLQASLTLTKRNTVIRGFKMVYVNPL
ncbi:transglutaminase 5, like [Lampris incognitus]|uniref:transglutaminase 5, like n=1 Tax=Lampris incognitus TaxID=2546036 RepID=UPI0024B4A1EB|nr:transglutaminase 5, like [Lampris incognitus]